MSQKYTNILNFNWCSYHLFSALHNATLILKPERINKLFKELKKWPNESTHIQDSGFCLLIQSIIKLRYSQWQNISSWIGHCKMPELQINRDHDDMFFSQWRSIKFHLSVWITVVVDFLCKKKYLSYSFP